MYASPEELGRNGESLGNWERSNEGGGSGAQGVTKHRRDIQDLCGGTFTGLWVTSSYLQTFFDHVPLNVAQSERASPKSILFVITSMTESSPGISSGFSRDRQAHPTLHVAGTNKCEQEAGESRLRDTLGGVRTAQAGGHTDLGKVAPEGM